MLAWVLNTPLLLEDSSNVLFFQRIFHGKVPEICSILSISSFNSSKKDFVSMYQRTWCSREVLYNLHQLLF